MKRSEPVIPNISAGKPKGEGPQPVGMPPNEGGRHCLGTPKDGEEQ